MFKQTQKTEKRKMTSVLSFFLLCTNTKNKKWLPFYHFSFYVRENTKKEKQKSTSVLSLFVFGTNKRKKRKNDKWLPFYRFSFYVLKHKNMQTEIDFRSIIFRCKYDQSMKERTRYDLIFCLYFFLLLWLFKWTKSRDREGSGRRGGGVWVGVGLGVVGQQFL